MKELFQAFIRFITHRLFILSIIILIMFSILLRTVFELQIIQGEEHLKNFTLRISREREITSTRGNIYDRYGRPLAINELAYSVVIDDSYEVNDKNKMIYDLITLIEKNGDKLLYNFPIVLNENGEMVFDGSNVTIKRFKELIFRKDISSKELSEDEIKMTADEMYVYIRDILFEIDEKQYSLEEILKIMNIRYTFDMNRYSKYRQVIIAVNISKETLTEIKENNMKFPGVNIIQDPIRTYVDAVPFSHIIGYTGKISQEQLDELKPQNPEYQPTDIVGKTGIEKEMELYLRGKEGKEKVLVNNLGKILEVTDRINPSPGKDVFLTIDKELQQDCYNILENNLAVTQADLLESTDEFFIRLIKNNVINIKAISEQRSDLERAINEQFIQRKNNSLDKIKEELTTKDRPIYLLNTEMQTFMTYAYDLLKTHDIIHIPEGPVYNEDDTEKENDLTEGKNKKDDSVYKAFTKNSISLSAFLKHALAFNYIDLEKIGAKEDDSDYDVLYGLLIDYILEALNNDQAFVKEIYYNLIKIKAVSPKNWCLLLYEQEIINDDPSMIEKLQNYQISAMTFIKQKLINLEITPAQLALPPFEGSIVVVDVNTGEVLALVSYPSYDNNRLANNLDAEYYRQLLNDVSKPLIHRALQSKSAVGSTYKMITGLAGLEEGVVTGNTYVYGEGLYRKISPAVACWIFGGYGGIHGSTNVVRALEVSCNYYFNEVAYRLSTTENGAYVSQIGTDILKKYATMLGLNGKTGIELPETEPKASDQDAVRTAIGQGTNNFAPIHLARYTATLANKGVVYNLSILDKIVNPDESLFYDKLPEIDKVSLFKEEHLKLIYQGMYNVTRGREGTATSYFADIPINVAGKSGTAQENKKMNAHSLFVSFAPYENPEIAVVAVIPYGDVKGNTKDVSSKVIAAYYGFDEKKENFNYDNTLR